MIPVYSPRSKPCTAYSQSPEKRVIQMEITNLVKNSIPLFMNVEMKINNKFQFLNFLADIIISIHSFQSKIFTTFGSLFTMSRKCEWIHGWRRLAFAFLTLHQVLSPLVPFERYVSFNLCSCPFESSFAFHSTCWTYFVSEVVSKDKIKYYVMWWLSRLSEMVRVRRSWEIDEVNFLEHSVDSLGGFFC